MMLRSLKSSTARLVTRLIVLSCTLRGQRLQVGSGTLINPGAKIRPMGGRISIGKNCFIAAGVVLKTFDGEIAIGDNVDINEYSILYGLGGLTIGRDCRIAAHVSIIPANHNFADRSKPIHEQGLTLKGISVGDDVWIGVNASILAGVTLGQGSIVAAGAVVTKSTAAYGIYAGNPARLIKERGEAPANLSI